jgi:hypothetical protein
MNAVSRTGLVGEFGEHPAVDGVDLSTLVWGGVN